MLSNILGFKIETFVRVVTCSKVFSNLYIFGFGCSRISAFFAFICCRETMLAAERYIAGREISSENELKSGDWLG